MTQELVLGPSDVAPARDALPPPRPRALTGRMKHVVAAGATVLAVAGGGVAWRAHSSAAAAAAAVPKTAAVEAKHLESRVTATGTLSALVTVQVGTQVSGRIQSLYVDYNSPVKKGALVAKLDPQLFEAAVQEAEAAYAQAKAGVATAEANAQNAQRQLARAKALRAQDLVSQADYDAAESTAATTAASVQAAKASLAQAAAHVNQARVNLSYTNIVSPIDGVVVSRSVDVGQTVAASLQTPTLFTIAQDLTKMQLVARVSEGDIGRLVTGAKASFTVDAFPGERFEGTVREIRNAATTVSNVVTYDAVIDVANPDLELRPGMTANVTVTTAERDAAMAVPNAALRYKPENTPAPSAPARGASDGKTLWVLRQGQSQAVAVRTGLTDGTNTEIVSGDLKPGDRVIVGAASGAPEKSGTAATSVGANNRAGGAGGGRPPGPMF